jgi:uncharacterized protein YigE (DUF2233 family)
VVFWRRFVIVGLLVLIAVLGTRLFPGAPHLETVAPLPRTPGPEVQRLGAYDVVTLPLEAWDVRITWSPGGTRLAEVEGSLRTNAGIFEPDFAPSGLLVSDGVVEHPLNSHAGEGNFYLLPNGVFSLGRGGAAVRETSEYLDDGVQFATQSGPLLLRRNVVHPKLSAESPNRALRSGVGVRDGGRTVVFVISREPVNLYRFATLFRDELGCADALYLDGVISALWAPDAGRDDDLTNRGPFAGIITASPRR